MGFCFCGRFAATSTGFDDTELLILTMKFTFRLDII